MMHRSGQAPVEIAVAIVEHEGDFLVGLRPPGVPLAGYWEFPGGKVRPGESPAAAAERECLEETGLCVRIGAPYPSVVHTYDHGTVRLHFFAGALVDPPRPPKPPFRWVGRQELEALRFPAANAQVIELLVGGKSST
jgi:mutator protein MutT